MEERSDIRPQEERSILINFVLDKSGSMEIIREATVAGFNQFLADQQGEGGSAAMTLTLFDTRFKTVVTALPVAEVRPLDRRSYIPGGNTALYDAIGHTLRLTDRYVEEHKPDQVLFVIMTDGQENASREFSQHQIMQLIEHRQLTADYEFIYLGANQDSYRVGAEHGPRRRPHARLRGFAGRRPGHHGEAVGQRQGAPPRRREALEPGLLLSGARGPRPRLL